MLAIIVAGIAVYVNSFSAPFVFDGRDHVLANPAIRCLWPPYWSHNSRPVAFFTFALNYAIDGEDVWGYHAVNVAIHVAAALVLFGLVRRTLLSPRLGTRYCEAAVGLAAAIALIWVVHPLQTQSVTYLYQRQESLMGLFYLLMLYTFARAESSSRAVAWYGCSLGCFFLGLGSKEVMVTAPLIVLWYDRVLVASSWRELWAKRKVYYLILASVIGIPLVLILQHRAWYAMSGVLCFDKITPWNYALAQTGVVCHYLSLCFSPQGQCLDYDWVVSTRQGDILLPILVILHLLGLTVWAMFRHPAWSFLGGWFFVILAPTSSFAPIEDLCFEHRMYLSLAAVVALVVLGGYELVRRWADKYDVPMTLRCRCYALPVLLIVIVMGTLTLLRNHVYRTEITIWNDVVTQAPHNARGQWGLGAALLEAQRYEESLDCFKKVAELAPRWADTHYNHGLALQHLGRWKEAIDHYKIFLRANPDHIGGYLHLAECLIEAGQPREAARQYREALSLNPNQPQVIAALERLTAAEEKQGQPEIANPIQP